MSLFRIAFSAFSLFLSCLFTLPAFAASSSWAENEGGRMRLVLLPAKPDGTRDGALVIEPQPGWVTYWKEPGDVGIPPSLTTPKGAAYAVTRVEFPVPKLLNAGGMRDVGYDAPVTLPFRLSGTEDGTPVTLHVFIGVCLNICIPFQADLTVMPSDEAVMDETALLETARARLPEAPSADFSVTGFTMQPDRKQLDVSLTIPAGTSPSAFFLQGPSGYVFIDGKFTDGPDQTMTLSVPIRKLPKTYTLAGKHWNLLVIAGNRAMEAPLAFD